ncbi:hypothetical protein B4110_1703 [Parageobacillus toebii]|uniref:Uncharacterized protein n=1 Tax=Parageobacillus toebii TaxID=153151 RepID=A0A150MNT8_9BACL|nr:hypothetical protein B4110_1703 [Parageobacillus toebii]
MSCNSRFWLQCRQFSYRFAGGVPSNVNDTIPLLFVDYAAGVLSERLLKSFFDELAVMASAFVLM